MPSPRLMQTFKVAMSVVLLGLVSGCAGHKYFTRDIRVENDLTLEEIQLLQFYVDNDVTLRAEARNKNKDSNTLKNRGKLKIVKERRLDDVLIDRETPGIAVGVGKDWIAISFEEGAHLYFLEVGSGHYVNGVLKGHWIYYDKKLHEVMGNTRLMFDGKLLERLIHNRRKVRGRRLHSY